MTALIQQTGAILTAARAFQNLSGFGNLSGLSGIIELLQRSFNKPYH
jgi:hypothetical protein